MKKLFALITLGLSMNVFAAWESIKTDPPAVIPTGYAWGCNMRSIAFDGLGQYYYGESGKALCNAETMHQPWEACIVQYDCKLSKLFVPEKGSFVCTAGSSDKGFIFKGYNFESSHAAAQAIWMCQQGSIESHTCVVSYPCDIVK